MTISIITATYNSEKTIANTIDSVFAQTFQDVDYWIIDGGSTDATMAIVQQRNEQYHGRIHWVSEPDEGIYAAMNKGIQRCSGKVVGILNSDDFFTSPHVLQAIANYLEQHTAIQAVYGDVHFVQPERPTQCTRYYSGRFFRNWLIPWGFIPPHPSFYVRKEVFDNYGYYNTRYRISADFELIARLSYLHAIPMHYLPIDMVTMRMGGVSTCSLQARWQGAKEIAAACRALGIRTNLLFVTAKYPLKLLAAFCKKKQ